MLPTPFLEDRKHLVAAFDIVGTFGAVMQRIAGDHEILVDRHARKQAAPLRHDRGHEFDRLVGRQGLQIDAVECQPSGFRLQQRPPIALTIDDLPAPLGPTMPTISPAPTLMARVVDSQKMGS